MTSICSPSTLIIDTSFYGVSEEVSNRKFPVQPIVNAIAGRRGGIAAATWQGPLEARLVSIRALGRSKLDCFPSLAQ
jgi:hypothetical protein